MPQNGQTHFINLAAFANGKLILRHCSQLFPFLPVLCCNCYKMQVSIEIKKDIGIKMALKIPDS